MRERRVIIPLSVKLYLDEISNHIIEHCTFLICH